MSPRLRRWLGWALAALLLAAAAIALRRVSLAEVAAALVRADPRAIAAALLLNGVSLALQASRWQCLLRPGGPARFGSCLGGILAGFGFSAFLPARGGEVFRVLLVARREGLPLATVGASSALDHVLATATIAVLSCFALPASGAGLALLLAGLCAGAGAGVLRMRAPARLARMVAALRAGLLGLGSARTLAAALATGTAAWACDLAVCWLSLRAFGIVLPASAAVAVLFAVHLAHAVPGAPANAGPFEAAAAGTLAMLGVPLEQGLAFAVGFHLLHVVPVALAGAVAWMALRPARLQEGVR
jgi:uncharacterized membrane protein YbhN (UPF0104 family)